MSAGTFFKTFNSSDRTTTRTLLHEAIPITGALVSGTYNRTSANAGREKNIKVYSHDMFQSVYDYPYLSSSANHIFDISIGMHASSSLSSSTVTNIAKKVNVYNQMAQVLNGYDTNGNIRQFDVNGDYDSGTAKMNETIFFNFSRLLVKDEVKKGSFSLTLGVGGFTASSNHRYLITDHSGSDGYFVNSPAGEYGILYATASTVLAGNVGSFMTGSRPATAGQDSARAPGTKMDVNGRRPCGLIFYQAGVCVLTASLFMTGNSINSPGAFLKEGSISGYNSLGSDPTFTTASGPNRMRTMLTGSNITNICDGIRNKFIDLSFNNTTELNSTIYFCRANHNEFNYSSNPTYLDSSKIRVKGGDILTPPRSYVTTVGMYSADNELLAVAKLSEPLRKDPTNELTLRVRLDY